MTTEKNLIKKYFLPLSKNLESQNLSNDAAIIKKSSELIKKKDSKYFVVYKMDTLFLGTSTIDDILEVKSIFKGINGVRLKINQDIFKDEKKVFSANIEFVLLDKNANPKRIPDDIRSTIEKYLSEK